MTRNPDLLRRGEPFAHALRTLRLTGVLASTVAIGPGPWATSMPHTHDCIILYFLTKGRCVGGTFDPRELVELHEGDVLLLPSSGRCMLAENPVLTPVPLEDLFERELGDIEPARGEVAGAVCYTVQAPPLPRPAAGRRADRAADVFRSGLSGSDPRRTPCGHSTPGHGESAPRLHRPCWLRSSSRGSRGYPARTPPRAWRRLCSFAVCRNTWRASVRTVLDSCEV